MKKRSCTHCGSTYPLDADHFFRNAENKSGFESVCKTCRGWAIERQQDHQRHVRRRRHELRPPRQHICSVCCNLPHARPTKGCTRCGLPYHEEEPVTLAYGAQFSNDRTVFPDMSGAE